ncbi:hypothetical protein PR202_ga08250 [Eleusine coracana subsp. coracana]|uniref:CRM domain-containing protein n=1 Tax=Eleusine coracana subsp. coracana TaxID=191504 RepID=A0AAV5C288_ELECO|nr:hypothetical protein PR202_ga08250 [Eleusine coracana subsp. coracana]
MSKPDDLTGEERFYLKKVSQKKSNYVPVGRRGVFGGVILNMHLHWKKHETVKVICKPCKPGQIQEYANEIARLSGGISVNIIGDDTIVFYRGKNYVQPDVMLPIDTLSKKKNYTTSDHTGLPGNDSTMSRQGCERFRSSHAPQTLLLACHDQRGSDARKASLMEAGELNQGKEQESQLATSDFSDLPISDISESDEDNSGSEYDANDDDTEDGIGID